MGENLNQGGVTWHCSEPDGGPDVGVSVCLDGDKKLWCGEISQNLYDELRGFDYYDGSGGWFIVYFSPKPMIIAKCGDQDAARAMMERIAWLAREIDVPTMAKTLSAMDQ